jgi:hypothetical protein
MARTREKFDAPWYAKFAFGLFLCVLVGSLAALYSSVFLILWNATPMILGRDLTRKFVGVSATAYEICDRQQGLPNISVAILDSLRHERPLGDLRL